MRKLLVLSSLFFSVHSFADLKIYTEEAPPLSYVKDGKLDGVSVAIVNEIRTRLGEKAQIEVVPWARGYDEVQKNPNVALFSTTRTEAREALFKWVGPLAQKKWTFYKKKGSAVSIKTLEDAKTVKSIGTYKDDAKEQFLKGKGFANLDSASADNLNIKKLMAGRIDLWLTGDDDMLDYAKKEGVNPSELEEVLVVDTKKLSIAFSKATADDVVKKWQDAYDSMAKDGTIKKIHDQYGSKLD